jgi:hypothetical protein
LRAGDDVHVLAGRGQMKGEIGKYLACRRMIGKEIPIDENQARHLNSVAGVPILKGAECGAVDAGFGIN